MADDYSGERYNPTLGHCGTLRLEFNGTRLRLLGGSRRYSYPADSGRPSATGTFDYSAARQRLSFDGPIPAGTYWIRPDELWTARWYHSSGTVRGWGNFRITIHPFTTTVTFSRGGFFIHGGAVRGSAGCIDLTAHMDRFVEDLRRELGGTETCQIHLTVRYR